MLQLSLNFGRRLIKILVPVDLNRGEVLVILLDTLTRKNVIIKPIFLLGDLELVSCVDHERTPLQFGG